MTNIKEKVVYLHTDINDRVFYVGMGSMPRAYDITKGARNYRWWAIAKDHCNVYIIQEGISKENAWEIEKELIFSFGRLGIDKNGQLTNIHPGGSFYGDHVKRKVRQYTLKGDFVKEWNSMREANTSVADYPTNKVGDCCQYKSKSFKGYQWFYAEEVGDLYFIGSYKGQLKGGHNASPHEIIINKVKYNSKAAAAKKIFPKYAHRSDGGQLRKEFQELLKKSGYA